MQQGHETPATMAAKLGVTPMILRRWLRGLVDSKHELAKHHGHNERWVFSPQDAKTLIELFRREHP